MTEAESILIELPLILRSIGRIGFDMAEKLVNYWNKR